MAKKPTTLMQWRENNACFHDFVYENYLDWPVTSVQWGPHMLQTKQYSLQKLYFSCKTDGVYNELDNTWTNTPNYIIMATVQLPNEQNYFIHDLKVLFNFDSAKKHPNLKINQIVSHPGQITVIRTSPKNQKILASKSDQNKVYIWASEKKYKMVGGSNSCNVPDITLMTNQSEKPNYALRFAPELPKIISASGDRLELFDIEGSPVKRELGSVLFSNLIKPLTVLEGHDKVEDIAFKNNEVCVSGGQDREIGIWDLRIGCLSKKITGIHDDDINTVACKGNYILSGGEEGRINIIDDRKYQVLHSFELHKCINSIQFNHTTNHFAIGREHLELYNLDEVLQTQKMDPLFTYLGMKGNINEFDWNAEVPMTLATTYQETETEVAALGGIIHIFRPLELFLQDREVAKKNLEATYNRLSEAEKSQLAAFL